MPRLATQYRQQMPQIPRDSTQCLTLAHLSDPHLTTLQHLGLRDLAGKRLLGYLSWQRRRQYIHRPQRLARLCQDLLAQQPDHILVSGDLTQLGSDAELRQARAWLTDLGPPLDVTVVPGNHDCYTVASHALLRHHWREFLQSDLPPVDVQPETNQHSGFPLLRRRGPVDLIGLDSAIATGCTQATGRLGDAQLARLHQQLVASAAAGQFRLLAIHHPPQPGVVSRRKRLVDAAALAAVLRQTGAELILHGHSHHVGLSHWCGVPMVGISSASSVSQQAEAMAAYHLIRVEKQAAGRWQLAIQRRRMDADGAARIEQLDGL